MKNVIVICADELRGDCTSFAGNPDILTPNMDRLAARGVVFARHMTSFPKCVPARCSLMTGRYCHADGWRTISQTLAKGQPELMGALKRLGYQTAVFGKNHCWHESDWHALDFRSHTPPMSRFLEGHTDFTPGRPAADGAQPLDLDDGWHYCGAGTRHMSDEAFAEQTVDFLTSSRDRSKSFFLQINFESPHPKYGVEEPWYSMYDREGIQAWPHELPKNAPLPVRAQREVRTGMEESPAACREVQAVYYGMISKVDHLLGKVLQAIESEGLWDNTIVLFWADHGDYAGQYGLAEKWDTHFADCLLHVPCVLIAPGLAPGRVECLSSTVDLAPTLCELLEMTPLPGMHGDSLLPVIRGKTRRRAVFADGGHEAEMRRRYAAQPRPEGQDGKRLGKSETYWRYPDSMARAKMVRTDRYKMVIRETGDNELYDLENDPRELDNRWGDSTLGRVMPELLRMLVEWGLSTDSESPYLDSFTV
jgi:arylsulfatase A-like enzyme